MTLARLHYHEVRHDGCDLLMPCSQRFFFFFVIKPSWIVRVPLRRWKEKHEKSKDVKVTTKLDTWKREVISERIRKHEFSAFRIKFELIWIFMRRIESFKKFMAFSWHRLNLSFHLFQQPIENDGETWTWAFKWTKIKYY